MGLLNSTQAAFFSHNEAPGMKYDGKLAANDSVFQSVLLRSTSKENFQIAYIKKVKLSTSEYPWESTLILLETAFYQIRRQILSKLTFIVVIQIKATVNTSIQDMQLSFLYNLDVFSMLF